MFIVTAWNNGGEGYGFKITEADRDLFFSRNIQTISLYLPDVEAPLLINIDKPSFWKNCRELIEVGIKNWLFSNNYAPWPNRKPPKFRIQKVDENQYKLIDLVQ